MINWVRKIIIGLDIDEGCAIACELAKKPSGVNLSRYAVGANAFELMESALMKDGQVVINISAQIVLFRSFYIPAALSKSKNKEKDTMAFLSRQNLPFKLEECFWDTFIWNNNLNFIAAKKEMVEKHITGIEDLGLRCIGVTVSLAALYNVLIYNYPEREKDRFAILNIRNSVSDLLIYEPRRIWIYPLSIGKKDFKEPSEALMKFSLETQRIFNAHYLQNPQLPLGSGAYFYLSGQECSQDLVGALKKVLPDFEVSILEPFKKIGFEGAPITNPENLALSLGLNLSNFNIKSLLNLNLIKKKIQKEKQLTRINIFKKSFFLLFSLLAAGLLVMNVNLFNRLNKQLQYNRDTRAYVSSLLPEVKSLKQEQERLKVLQGFLDKRLRTQMLYLKVLALVSESKSDSIIIKDFSAEKKDWRLQVFISGTASTYEQINNMLANLKKNQDIKDVKVVASTFPVAEAEANRPIDFKLRFEIEL